MNPAEVFSDSSPGGSAESPKTGSLASVVTSGSTDANLRITNTSDDPLVMYYRKPAGTYYKLEINPGVSIDTWLSLDVSLSVNYYFDTGAIKVEVVYFYTRTESFSPATAFTNSTPAGSASAPLTGDLSEVIPVTATDAVLLFANTSDDPMILYWRKTGTTTFYKQEINPGASEQVWISLTAALTFEYYFDTGILKVDVLAVMGTGLTTTYTLAEKVASLLRLIVSTTQARLIFSASTDPTLLEVQNYILEAETFIDKETNHAWKARTITNEYHDILPLWSGQYRREIPVKLNHRSVRTMVSGTDKIEYWDGSSWIDMVATLVEGRANDFWIDYTYGIVYFVNTKPRYSERGVRFTYRYGETSIPYDIQDAATKLAAMKILENEDYKIVLPEGISAYAIASKIESWKKDVDRILTNRKELIFAGGVR